MISERRLIGARVYRGSALRRFLQAENADESGHEDDRQEGGCSDDVRIARHDPHATCPDARSAPSFFVPKICVLHGMRKDFHGL